MKYKQSLRRRITLSFVLFGAILSIVIATGVYHAIEDIEAELVENGMALELTHFLNQSDQTLGTTDQIGANIFRYYVSPDQKRIVPEVIRDLAPGTHNVEYDGLQYHVLVATTDNGTVYLVKDATSFEHREVAIQTALVTTVIIAILTALGLGTWLSGKVISPVSALARQVAELKPNSHTSPRIAIQYAEDEVGQLASSFDDFLKQMELFIKREQEFTADASHELRTPLMIISGAAELLLENTELSPRAIDQVKRITRACDRMKQLLEALLLLARETTAGEQQRHESCQAAEVTLDITNQLRPLIKDKTVTLNTNIIADFEVAASRTILSIVLSNLVQNAINYTEQGEVTVAVNSDVITITDTGKGISTQELKYIFDRHYRGGNSKVLGSGIGLSIVKRICDRQHWLINVESAIDRGTSVSLRF